MATDGGVRGLRDSFRRSLRRFRPPPELREEKKLSVFGAPQCRCTPLVLALCVGLTGLVVVGIGSCMAAFMWNDNTPKALGLSLVGLGIAMIAAGIGLSIYDSKVKSLMPPRNPVTVTQTYQQGAVQQAPSSLPPSMTGAPARGQTIETITNVHAMPSNSQQGRRSQMNQDIAPPAYDAVLQEDLHYRSNQGNVVHQQQVHVQANNNGRTVVRETRTTSVV